MSRNIESKVAVVTGGAEGIGYEIADNFLKNGAGKVIILDINEPLGKEAVAKLIKNYGEKVDFFKCDVTKDLESVSEAIFGKYNTVDILVNNAGILNEIEFRKTIEINLTSFIEWSYKFIDHMRTDKGGKGGTIVNLASVGGFRIDPFFPVYIATKHALMGFTKSLGHEYNFNRYGVRVIALCPGVTHTKLSHDPKRLRDQQASEDVKKHMASPALVWQTPVAVGKAAIEVFKRADSGTAWIVEGGTPITQVP